MRVNAEGNSSAVQAGWYPDPADATRLRRWDGLQWTNDVLVNPQQAPAPLLPAQPASPPFAPANPTMASAPPVAPTFQPAPPQAPTPPAVNQHPSSGPVSLPDWANLPGLTLPPDLSAIPGMAPDSVLGTPTFGAVQPDPRPSRDLSSLAPEIAPPATPPATPYAPPPVGVQYDVPPPPGMAHLPSSATVLPPSAFIAPQPLSTGWPPLPPVGSVPPASAPVGELRFADLSRTADGFASAELRASTATVSSWLIGILPLLQFAIIYVVFKVLGVELAPGMQWGILAAPAAFSLLFANADKKRLTILGERSPSIVLAFIPPLYLLVRCVTTGRSSALPLVVWFILQAGAAAGVYFLLPDLLATAIRFIG